MSKTPAQKRRRDFKRPEDWGRWALNVLRSNRRIGVQINCYSTSTSVDDLLRGIKAARRMGAVIREEGPHDARVFMLEKEPANA